MRETPLVPPIHMKNTMKAWVAQAYGGPDVLALVDRPRPEPGPGMLLIRVRATTVASADRRIRAMDFPPGLRLVGRALFGFRRPRRAVLGVEMTGEVMAVGARVRRFSVGDAVLGMCGTRLGAHAEYLAWPESAALAARPADMPPSVAAAFAFGGLTARDFLRRAGLRAGERVLVIGAAGTVGSALVQLATAAGADVTAVASAANRARVLALGATAFIDYQARPVSRLNQRYAVIADAVGTLSFAQAMPLLDAGGRFLAINGGLADLIARPRAGRRCVAGPAAERADDLVHLIDLWRAGQYTPMIDSEWAFTALREAHARVDSGHKRGSVVVWVDK